jgi:hypothetical protein
MRVASLLPGITELLYQLGLGTSVVGRGADNALPSEVRGVPVVASPRLAAVPDGSAPLVDGVVPHAHVSKFAFDRAALSAAAPDVVVFTEACPICAAAYVPSSSAGGVDSAVSVARSATCRLVSVAPGGLDAAVGLIGPLAAGLGQPRRGAAFQETRAARLLALRMHVARHLVLSGAPRPRVAFVPPSGPEQVLMPWLADMIDASGGALLPDGGGDPDALGGLPDILLLGTRRPDDKPDGHLLRRLAGSPVWRDLPAVRNGRTWQVQLIPDFAHYGPRLIEGVETLVRIVLPQALGANGTPPAPHQARRLR